MTSVPHRPLEAHARIVIAGAGSVGCYIGGLLALGGRNVIFLGRPRMVEALQSYGLRVTDLAGLDERLDPDKVIATTDAAVLGDADLVLVTVKSTGTAAIAEDIAARCSPGTTVLSLQNGVGNLAVIRSVLDDMPVLGGTVEYNVIHKGGGQFHRTTSGGVIIEAGRDDLYTLLSVPRIALTTTDDIQSLHWGKLFLNLNNALNALSGIPLRDQMLDRDWRRLLADQIDEALRVVRAAGIAPTPLPTPPRLIPPVLRLPTPIFRRVAARILKIDPEARSSMYDDLVQRRATEIDYLQGAVVRLGREHGVATPLSERIISRVKQAEDAAAGPPGLTPDQIRHDATRPSVPSR